MIDPPLEITDFLDRLHTNNQQIVPGSLIWLYILSEAEGPHPGKPGRWVAAVTPVPSGDCEALMDNRGQVVEAVGRKERTTR